MIGSIGAQAPGIAPPRAEDTLRVGPRDSVRAEEAAVKPVAEAELKKALRAPGDIARILEDKLNAYTAEILGENSRLSIAEDEATGNFVYRSIDKTSGEVIRQYPPEEILRLIEYLEKRDGLLLDERA